jgi:hypothetical protein
MTVNMVTLPVPQSCTKRPKPTALKNDAFPHIVLYLPNHKSFGYSELLIWFRDGAFRDGHWYKCEMPNTDISQENDHAMLIVKRQFMAYNFRWTAVDLHYLFS